MKLNTFELKSRTLEDTKVIHVLHPAIDLYVDLLEFKDHIQETFGTHHLEYFAEQDSFVFFKGNVDCARDLAQEIIINS